MEKHLGLVGGKSSPIDQCAQLKENRPTQWTDFDLLREILKELKEINQKVGIITRTVQGKLEVSESR